MCQGRSTPYVGDGRPLTFNDGILIMGPYKPLRNRVDDHPLLYGNNRSLDGRNFHLTLTLMRLIRLFRMSTL